MDVARHAQPIEPDKPTRDFYTRALRQLDDKGIAYAVGGGYALAYYSGIARNTKDLDIFIRPRDRDVCLAVLADMGARTEFFYPFWIAKAIDPATEAFVDILYNSGNGLCPVDDEWFEHTVPIEVHGYPTRLIPAEEQLWTKAFVQDRDRFDGADVIHLVLGRGRQFDWHRLIRRFKGHEGVLLAHLVLFGYAYPGDRQIVPAWVTDELRKLIEEEASPAVPLCRGTFLAHKGYGVALRDWGYVDARLMPHGLLLPEEVAQLPRP